ncbi:MAG: beta-propeller repeat protein [Labilithrix sp.]|nr:beta-propeller repeat protein [Labilithrix sp.]
MRSPSAWLLLTCITCVASALPGCRRASNEALRVFVTNEDSGTVSVIDAARDEVIATIPVGKRPRGVRASKDGKLLYVALSGSRKSPPGAREDEPPAPRDDAADGIAVVDLAKGAVVQRLPSGRDPEAFDVSADGATLYVSNEETAELSVVDTRSAKITHVTPVGGEPEGVTLSPDGTQVYVTSEAAGEVDVLQAGTGALLARIPTGMRPRYVAFSGDGAQAFVSAELGGVLHVIDTTSRAAVGQIRTGKQGVKPMGIALAPDGTRAYVANGREGSVGVVDVASRRLEKNIDGVGKRPWGIAITPDGKKLYVAAMPDVAVVDVASGAVVRRIPVGDGPWGVAVGRGAR